MKLRWRLALGVSVMAAALLLGYLVLTPLLAAWLINRRDVA